ncbi:alpha/beta hydrolase [uncultured Desulfosarcina sp.]|uniref:alpha/beta fold hydrolase n=1 Tax=uncultured Desulfosarcina sp. TaxID=218289 RepID=UPI0029C679C6|nr:alpha/beta hydrolase [uncultured Desulfosarcina sp.]
MMRKNPLILIPGLLCDHALWQHQVAVVGQISECIVTDKHMQYETIGRIAEEIVADAPDRFALAGLSMGGYIALEICRKYGRRVERLALIDTSARADTAEQTEKRQKLIALCRQGKFADVSELLFSVLVHPDRYEDTALKQRIVDMADRIGPEIFIRQQQAIMGRSNQVPFLADIRCPTVIVCGEQDQVTPRECSEEMAALIQGSQLEIIPDCGHMTSMEKPEKVSAILLEWLTVRSS